MTTDAKKLAEFAAEFLGSQGPDIIDAQNLFNNYNIAPILAHLAKREMEKRNLTWELGFHECVGFSCKISEHYKSTGRYSQLSFVSQQENEYQALWSAIKEAVEEK